MASLRPVKVDFDSAWLKIKGTLQCVITLSKVTRSEWNERFSDVYAVCVSNQDGLDEQLYQETKKFFEQHTKDIHTVSFSDSRFKKYEWKLYKHYIKSGMYIFFVVLLSVFFTNLYVRINEFEIHTFFQYKSFVTIIL